MGPFSTSTKAALESALSSRFGTAARFRARPAPALLSTGIAEADLASGGLPRGAITEIRGAASSGRTTLAHAILAEATRRGEVCALIDTSDAFDPVSGAAAGIDFRQLLWVRCAQNTKHVLAVTGLVLQAGGFGLVVLDLADIAPRDARRIPLNCWFRFRRAIESTPTALMVLGQEAYAGASSSLVLEVHRERDAWSGVPGCSRLLRGLELRIADCGSRIGAGRERANPTPATFKARAL